MAQTTRLRSEVESFQHFIFNTIDSIVGVLDGLSAEELNWRPIAPATNSLYAIATHVLGNAEENLLGTLCDQPHCRNYPTEFSTAAPVPDAVRARWVELRERGREESGEQTAAQHERPLASPGARQTVVRVGSAPRLTT